MDGFIEWNNLLQKCFRQMTFHHQKTVNTIAISHKTVLLSQELKKKKKERKKTCLLPNIALY